MTTPDERTRAVVDTRRFLELLCSATGTSGVGPELREDACRLLRHYPEPGDLQLVATALPLFWGHPASKRRC